MRSLLLLVILAFRAPLRAEPGYQRPDLAAPLFDAAALDLSDDQTTAILRELNLLARNFPEHAAVTHRIRARALGLALQLRPDDRTAVVANGQLARGVRPAPLPCEISPVPSGIALRLHEAAVPLIHSPSNATRQLALLLCDLAIQLDPRLRRRTALLTYLAVPDWHDPAPAPVLDAPRTFALRQTSARILLPGVTEGRLSFLTVTASAAPAAEKKGLRVVLPEPLLQAMRSQEKPAADLRASAEQRMAALRAALRQRHESWPEGWTVSLSTSGGDPAALPQLFAGIALTLDSLLSGEPLDEQLIFAAALGPDGALRSVIPPAQLLPAAALAHSPPLLLPAAASEEVTDWLLLNPDQWPLLFRVTLYSVADLPEALTLTRSSRASRLAQSLTAFDAIAARLAAAGDPLAELRKPETIARLRDIATWHSRHLSAAALLTVAVPGPATLSIRGSLARMDAVAGPILSTDRKAHPLHTRRKSAVTKTEFAEAAVALQSLKLLHPSVRPYLSELLALGKQLDYAQGTWRAYLKDNGPPDPPAIAVQRRQAAAVRATLEAGLR